MSELGRLRSWLPVNRLGSAFALVASTTCLSAPTTPFIAFGKSGDEASASFCTTLGSDSFTADARGRLQIAGRRGGSLPLTKSETVDWLWALPLGSDILIAFEASDRTVDGSSGGLCRFSGDLVKRRWCTHFPAFNVVASLSSDETVFLAGIGTIAEVAPRSGKYLWKVSGLYERSPAFIAFFTPVERGDIVEFYATAGTAGAGTWQALVERSAGRLRSTEAVASHSNDARNFARSAGSCGN